MGIGNLFYWAVVFLIIAIIAGIFGFGGAEATAFSAAHLIFYIAIVLLIISLILGFLRRGV
jgi:uncharacterized membrane protein YtjA (UPF0391 family)